MKKYILAFLSLAMTAAAASAIEVECTAGTLASRLAGQTSATELTVSGTVDASDLFFIAQNMPGVRTLDLSRASIAAYKGQKLNGIAEYPAAMVPQGVFAATRLESVSLPATSPLSIGDFAFAGSALREITLPTQGVSVGQGAFASCTSLTKASLKGYRSGGYAFKGCVSLAGVELGGANAVGASDFAGCSVLATVGSASTLTEIGDAAFESCASLQTFDFGQGLKSIGASAFAHSALRAAGLTYCDALRSVGDWAFAFNTTLSEASLPAGLASLGRGAFFDCTSLDVIDVPENCRVIPDYALKGASSLSTVTLPVGVEEVGAYALKGATGTQQVSLPSSLEFIGDHAMDGMTGLSQIDATTLGYVPDLGNEVWTGVDASNVKLNVAESMAHEFRSYDQWKEFSINAISSNTDIVTDPGQGTVRARFEGSVLRIESRAGELRIVELYDAAGRLLTRTGADALSVAIETSDYQTNIFMVRCIMADGLAVPFKLAR